LDPLEIFVFSFDRGAHLAWCLDSIARLAPGFQVTVVDDRSTDPSVDETLAARSVRVLRPEAHASHRLGGLYANMRMALDTARARRVMFVQDDCQMIRRLDDATLRDLDTIFAPADQVNATPLIPMGPRQRRRLGDWRPIAGGAAFHYDPPDPARASPTARHFYAISILDVEKLRRDGVRLRDSEAETARAFEKLGAAPMAHLARPLLAQLPEVPTTRFGRRTLGARLAERLDGPEMRGFEFLSDPESEALARPDRPPLAEEVLTPTHAATTRPFIHKGVNRRLWTRALNRIEMRGRR
jgi:hypothetical protein